MASATSSRPQGYYHEIKAALVEHDPVFANLVDEKRRGWESKDVEKLWKLRTEKLNFQNDKRASQKQLDKQSPQVSENPFSALVSRDNSDDDEPTEESSVPHQRVMRAAGKGPSYDKYYAFYKELFDDVTEHSSVFSLGHKRFVDIGCAPGGLCAYFIRDLGWSGIGFTLQLERGGLKVRFKDPALQVHYCDMSEIESVDFITQHICAQNNAKYDFINCGVVMGKHQLESMGEDRETALQILRVNRNEFLIALKWLKNGGDLFWIFQSSNIGCWFYFLEKLQNCFSNPIALFSTLVPSRSPVYALCSGFIADSPAVVEWIAELEEVVEFTEHHLQTWNMTSWEQAAPLIESMRVEMYKIWNRQREGLKEIREAASEGREANLLKKLSGSRHGGAYVEIPQSKKGGKADDDGDWRRGGDDAGWTKTTTGKSLKSFGKSNSSDNWRR